MKGLSDIYEGVELKMHATEMVRVDKVSQVSWFIPEWDEHKDMLKSVADCIVTVGEEGSSKVRLRFFFKEKKDREHYWLSLCVQVLSGGHPNEPLGFQVKIRGNHKHDVEFVIQTKKERQCKIVKDYFIHERSEHLMKNGKGRYWRESDRPRCLNIILLVRRYRFCCNRTFPEKPEVKPTLQLPDNSLGKDLGTLFGGAANDTFSDLKFKTKDNMVINAHKFIVAARCPAMKKLMEEKSFSGTIKLNDVGGKPLKAILHWMYTDQLGETAGDIMGDVVAAAIKFELDGILKHLGKELVTFCNVNNMHDLYNAAKKNKMESVLKEIAQFISEHT